MKNKTIIIFWNENILGGKGETKIQAKSFEEALEKLQINPAIAKQIVDFYAIL